MATAPLNILCLDGGGVRGLSALLILRAIMQRLSFQLQKESLPCEVFDMICGTSTGGLIAVMLGRLRMTTDDAIASYIGFSTTVFAEQRSETAFDESISRLLFHRALIKLWSRFLGDPGIGKTWAKYDASKLEQWVMDLVAKYQPNGQYSLQDPLGTDKCCRTFVVAVPERFMDSPPVCFRSFESRGMPADTCKIWEAVRATTAISPFFEPAAIGDPPTTYLDGSYSGAYNPSDIARNEVRAAFPSREIGCFLSLGTGVPDDVVSGHGGPDKLADACLKLMQSCELVHNKVEEELATSRVPYFRFSVQKGLGNIQLDEWNCEEELVAITDGFMRFYEEEEKARRCVEALKAKAADVAASKQGTISLDLSSLPPPGNSTEPHYL